MGNCFARRSPDENHGSNAPQTKTQQLEGAGNSTKTKCNTASSTNDGNKPITFQRQQRTPSEPKSRSGSMQSFWANGWDKIIGDRSTIEMANEAEQTECSKSHDECNCIQRVIVIMNIYKFWNDRKAIVESICLE